MSAPLLDPPLQQAPIAGDSRKFCLPWALWFTRLRLLINAVIPSGILPGSDTWVFFNDAGALGADANFTFQKATSPPRVDVGGDVHAQAFRGPLFAGEDDATAPADTTLKGGDGTSGDASGANLILTTGAGSGAGGSGNITIIPPTSEAAFPSGFVDIEGAPSTARLGGAIYLGEGSDDGEGFLGGGNILSGQTGTGGPAIVNGGLNLGSGDGGNARCVGGDSVNGTGGSSQVVGGGSTSGAGGLVNVIGGNAAGASAGGAAQVKGGDSASGTGGRVEINAGNFTIPGSSGYVKISAGNVTLKIDGNGVLSFDAFAGGGVRTLKVDNAGVITAV